MTKLKTAAILFLISIVGCQIPSKKTLKGVGCRADYNESALQTNNEQLLLNLVRLRYSDTPFFFNVQGVTNKYTQKGKVTASLPLPTSERNPFSVSGTYEWQNTPTLSYAPLGGSAFAKRLMQPLDIQLLQRIIYSGWDIKPVFRLTLDSIAGVPNTNSDMPEQTPQYLRFDRALELMQELQRKDLLHIGIINGTDKKPSQMQLSFPCDSPQAEELVSILEHTKVRNNKCFMTLPVGLMKDQKLGIWPRSLLECMYYLSFAVHVPQTHLASEEVLITRNAEGQPFNWDEVVGDFLIIRSSYRYPQGAYTAIRYRGYWFYIDQYDLRSKRTFALLTQLYNLQHLTPALAPNPLITLPEVEQ